MIVTRNLLFSKIFVDKHVDPKKIPIIINNRNRHTFLKGLIDFLLKNKYTNIYIIDNNSSYKPLLDYYSHIEEKVNIIYSKENLGYLALYKIGLYDKVKYSYFVYTDSDVVPIEECPPDFIAFFLDKLKKHPKLQKVGFSLKLDDLPDYFEKKEEVIAWESGLYSHAIDQHVVIAPIDTTFALHRPLARISTDGRFKHARSMYPYEARHMPWYNNSRELSEEEMFYINSVEIGTHWSNSKPTNSTSFILKVRKWLLN